MNNLAIEFFLERKLRFSPLQEKIVPFLIGIPSLVHWHLKKGSILQIQFILITHKSGLSSRGAFTTEANVSTSYTLAGRHHNRWLYTTNEISSSVHSDSANVSSGNVRLCQAIHLMQESNISQQYTIPRRRLLAIQPPHIHTPCCLPFHKIRHPKQRKSCQMVTILIFGSISYHGGSDWEALIANRCPKTPDAIMGSHSPVN